MSAAILVGALVLFAIGIIVFTLYWLSSDRFRFASPVGWLVVIAAGFSGALYVYQAHYGVPQGWARLTLTGSQLLLGYVYLHSWLLANPSKRELRFYVPIGEGAFCTGCVFFAINVLVSAGRNQEFLLLCLLTSALAIAFRRWEPTIRVFQITAACLVLLFVALVIVDATSFHDRDRPSIGSAVAASAAFNAMYATMPFFFIRWGMLRYRLGSELEMTRVFNWTVIAVLGSLVYQDPQARTFISSVPVMKDFVPATGAAIAYFLPLGSLLVSSTGTSPHPDAEKRQ